MQHFIIIAEKAFAYTGGLLDAAIADSFEEAAVIADRFAEKHGGNLINEEGERFVFTEERTAFVQQFGPLVYILKATEPAPKRTDFVVHGEYDGQPFLLGVYESEEKARSAFLADIKTTADLDTNSPEAIKELNEGYYKDQQGEDFNPKTSTCFSGDYESSRFYNILLDEQEVK